MKNESATITAITPTEETQLADFIFPECARRLCRKTVDVMVLIESLLSDDRLVESPRPGKSSMGLLEERRLIYEREARAFAAELLMPFFEVRKKWFAISQEHPVEGELSTEGRVERLAAEFGVTPAAIRVRLQQMKLIPS